MIRTRIREDQGADTDFLSEQEGSERFVFRDGYGENISNLVIDGYLSLKNQISAPTHDSNYSTAFSMGGLFYTPSASGNVQLSPFSSSFTPTLKIGGNPQTTNYQIGHYTTIADLVFVAISLDFPATVDTGLVTIDLPEYSKNIPNLNQTMLMGGFEVSETVATYGGQTYGSINYTDATLSSVQILAHIAPNVNYLTLRKLSDNTNVNGEDLPNKTLSLSISGFYFR